MRVTKVDFERCQNKIVENPLDICVRFLPSTSLQFQQYELSYIFDFSRIGSQVNLKVSCCRFFWAENARSIVIATFESDKNVWKSVGTLNFHRGGTSDPQREV